MNETVTITREEYDRLLEAAEDQADLVAYLRAKAESGEGLPHAFMLRMIDGESPLRVIRDWRGLNQSSLARASGVHRVQIADIEARRSRGSVETLKKLAEALNVPMDSIA